MRRKILFGTVTVMIAVAAVAFGAADQDVPTFTRDVLPILQGNCQSCHRPAGTAVMGMVAPMSLITYDEVRPWAKSIARNVADRTMPPWHATREFDGVFSNQRTLLDEEIELLVKWAGAGAMHGDDADAPPPLDFGEGGWQIGEPDLIVPFREAYFIADKDGSIRAYAGADPGDPRSPIIEKAVFQIPPEVTGLTVGMNMTFDGWLIVPTEHGYVVAISRDLKRHRFIRMRHSEGAE